MPEPQPIEPMPDDPMLTYDQIMSLASKQALPVLLENYQKYVSPMGSDTSYSSPATGGIAAAGKALVNAYNEIVFSRKSGTPHEHADLERPIADALLSSMQLGEITPFADADVLQKLVEKERVHPMHGGVEELKKNRLSIASMFNDYLAYSKRNSDGNDAEPTSQMHDFSKAQHFSKHAYGLFLPWEDTPSCVIYTAHKPAAVLGDDVKLSTRDIPSDISEFRDTECTPIGKPRYVMFYSISNISDDLPGIRIGPKLIEKLGEKLKKEFTPTHLPADQAKNFITLSTLSPIRSFPEWLHNNLDTVSFDGNAVEETGQLTGTTPAKWLKELMPVIERQEGKKTVYEIGGKPPTLNKEQQALFDALRHDLCLYYVTQTRKDRRGAKTASDDVADFHLGNGAIVANIAIQRGENSEWKEAGGVMINYLYGRDKARNAEQYAANGTIEIAPELHKQLTIHGDNMLTKPNSLETFGIACHRGNLGAER